MRKGINAWSGNSTAPGEIALDAFRDIDMLLDRLEQQAPRYASRVPNRSGPGTSEGSGYSP